ncbi:hypothetical protein HY605_03120 [Candidatus Peregrinibacteria bacterium]|nr:hypothetical protein [Candidatus Peregrinibacteria bacterium]
MNQDKCKDVEQPVDAVVDPIQPIEGASRHDVAVLRHSSSLIGGISGRLLGRMGGPLLLALGLSGAPNMALAQDKDPESIEAVSMPSIKSSELDEAENGSGQERFAIARFNKDQSNPDAFSQYVRVSNPGLSEKLSGAIGVSQQEWINHAYKALGEGITEGELARMINWNPDDMDGFYKALEKVANFKLKDFIEAVYLKQSFVPHEYKESVKIIVTDTGEVALLFDMESTGFDFDRLTETAMKMGIMEKDMINYLKHGRPLSIPYSILRLKIPPKDVPVSFGILILILMAAHLVGTRMAVSRYGAAAASRDAYVGTVRGALAEDRFNLHPPVNFERNLSEDELEQFRRYLRNDFGLEGQDIESVLEELQRNWNDRLGTTLDSVDTVRTMNDIRSDWDGGLEALSMRDPGELRWRVSNHLRHQANVVSAALRGFAQRTNHRTTALNRQLGDLSTERLRVAQLLLLQLLEPGDRNLLQNPPEYLEEVREQALPLLEEQQELLSDFENAAREFQAQLQRDIQELNTVFNRFHRDGLAREALRFLALDPMVRPPILRVLVRFGLAALATGALAAVPNLLPDDRSFSEVELRAVPTKAAPKLEPAISEPKKEAPIVDKKAEEAVVPDLEVPPSSRTPNIFEGLDGDESLAPSPAGQKVEPVGEGEIDELVE